MLLFLSIGCMGTFTTSDGLEPVRGALYFAPDSTLSLAVTGGRQALVVLANSSLPCEPVDEDDPTTPQDEAADGQKYFDAQLATAFSREGALVVALMVAVDATTDWIGEYSLHADAWDSDAVAGYVRTDGRVGAGAWYRVDESAVEDNDGNFYTYTVTEDSFDDQVAAPAWVEIDSADQEMTGKFSFTPTRLSGHFRAERCDNLDLLAQLYLQLATLSASNDDTLVFPGE